MEEKIFNISGSRIKSVIVCFISSLFLLFIFDMIIFKPIPNDTVAVNMILVAVLSVAFAVLAFFLHKDEAIKLCDTGIDYIVGNKTTHYDFKDFLGTKVIKNSYNGITTGYTRHINLHVPGSDNKTTYIDCSYLKAEQFDELIASLSKNDFEQSENKQASEDYFNVEQLFEIPKQTIVSKNRAKSNLANAVIIVCAVILIAFFIILFYDQLSVMILITLIIALLTGLIVAVRVWQFKKFRNMIPEKITIDNYTLAVDGRTFSAEHTFKIVMTPPSYDTKDRILVITCDDKTVAKYSFARLNNSKPAMSYPDYPRLYNNIKLWCLQRNKNFMASLS